MEKIFFLFENSKSIINQDGLDSFIYRIDKIFSSQKECLEYEYYILKHFSAANNDRFLNLAHGKSVIWTDEVRKKASKSHTGIKLSDQHRNNISIALTGIKRGPPTKEHKQKLIDVRTGSKRSETAKENMKLAQRKSKPKYFFKRGSETFTGCMVEWAELYNLNVSSATTIFHYGRKYFGWERTKI